MRTRQCAIRLLWWEQADWPCAAIELAMQGVEVVVVDDNDKVSWGSRAVCYAKRPLEILDRIGCGDQFVDKGVQWHVGKVFFRRASGLSI